MNRKLRNTVLALSVTGMMLAVGLMSAHPVLPVDATRAIVASDAPAAFAPAVVAARAHEPPAHESLARESLAADALEARIDAHSRRFEADLADAESIEHAVALTTGFVAAVTTEAVLLETLGAAAPAAGSTTTDADDEARPRKRRSGGVRGAIAVPYFSFARGTGRGDRS